MVRGVLPRPRAVLGDHLFCFSGCVWAVLKCVGCGCRWGLAVCFGRGVVVVVLSCRMVVVLRVMKVVWLVSVVVVDFPALVVGVVA